jgi:hypothetical protein
MVWQANRITGELAATSGQRERRRAISPLRQVQRRVMAWWMRQFMTAVGNDIVIAETLFRVRNLTAPPTRLQDPRFHARVVVANLRRRHAYLSSSSLRRPIVDDIAAERAALAESLSAVGPSAPTARGDWTALDLAAHLVSEERLGGVLTFLGRSLAARGLSPGQAQMPSKASFAAAAYREEYGGNEYGGLPVNSRISVIMLWCTIVRDSTKVPII